MPLRERLIDFAVPQRKFKKELNREIEDCLNFFQDPCMIKGIGVTVRKLGRSGHKGELLDVASGGLRGYFWEKDGIRHMVGQEVMTRKQKDELVNKIHHVTVPYAEKTEAKK